MLKRRDTVAIGNVGEFNIKISVELSAAQAKLKKDVDSILEVYKGVDAEAQVAKFNEDIAKLSTIIRNLEYYGRYMKIVSSHDSDNLNHTRQQFSSIINTTASPSTAIMDQTVGIGTFNLNNLDGDLK